MQAVDTNTSQEISLMNNLESWIWESFLESQIWRVRFGEQFRESDLGSQSWRVKFRESYLEREQFIERFLAKD